MSLLAPLALALALLSIPIVLMYVLKLRRQQHIVSSTLLWRRALDDMQANAPWQRLRPSILLLLQLVALLALVLALAGPAFSRSRPAAGDLILIVDESYGMQAHDVAPTRFAAALAQAHGLVGDVSGGNVVSVIGMAAQPRLAIAESGDAGAIGGAIDGLRPGVAAPNFLGALSLATSLARSGEATRVVVLTSRESGISALPLRVPFPVELIRIGAPVLHDLGITAFSAGRAAKATRALARIGNFGGAAESSDLDLCVDGQLADVRPVQIGPGKQVTILWTNLPGSASTLQVRLAHADDVDIDKSVWAVIGSVPPGRVLLVSPGDYFTQTALSLNPSIRLRTITPESYRTGLAQSYDLAIFDGTLPGKLPATPTLILSPPAGRARIPGGGTIALGRFRPAGEVSAPAVPPGGKLASILQLANLSDVHVARSRESSLPGWMVPIAVSTTGQTLLAAGESRGQRVVAATFKLQESDWPLQVSFPILIHNLVGYLAPPFGPDATNVAAGQTVQFRGPPGTTEIRITRPDGAVDVLREDPGSGVAAFADTARAGIYTATADGARASTVRFAINVFPARPAPAPGGRVIRLGVTAPRTGSGSGAPAGIPISVGWAFALAGLVVLSAEWWFAFRR